MNGNPMSRRVCVLLFLSALLSSQVAIGQGQSFDISGPQNVCVDGVTEYTYTGGYEFLTWTIIGGVIQWPSPPVNTSSVVVRWTSASGQLFAGGTQEENCWWDDANYPPVWTCDVTEYGSNAFSVTGTVVAGGSISGTSILCAGENVTLTLSGHTGSITRWEKNTGTGWSNISSTSATLVEMVTATTQFRALLTAGSCTQYSPVKTITIDPVSIGGKTVVTATGYVAVSATLSVSGQTGSVIRWEKNETGSWVSTGVTTPTYSFAGLTQTTQYRAAVKSGVCSEVFSATLTAELFTLTYGVEAATLSAPSGTTRVWYKNGQTISGATAATYSASVPAGYTVSVDGLITGVYFVYFTLPGALNVCVDGVTEYTYSGPEDFLTWTVSGGVFTSDFTDVSYVQVRWTSTSGQLWATGTLEENCWWDDANYPPVWTCETTNYEAAAFSVTGTVVAGGSISGTSLLCAGEDATLTLSGHTGSVTRWEKNPGTGWSNISSTSATLVETVTATTQFRALVTAGACTQYSSIKTVTADPVSIGGKTVVTTTGYATVSATLSVSGQTGSVIRWEKNETGSWVSTGVTTPTYSFAGLTQTTQFRAAVKSGVCSETFSAALTAELPTLNYGGGAATLSAPSGTTRVWYNNGQPISGATAATYSASVPAVYTASVDGLVTGLYFVYPALSNYSQGVNAVSSTVILKAGVKDTTNLFTLPPNEVRQTVSYQDALGRTFQTVAVRQSPVVPGQSTGQKDIIAPVGIGRQGLTDTTYMPYVSAAADGRYRVNALKGTGNSYAGSEQFAFYQGTAKVAVDAFPFATSKYRITPDARVIEQGAPGEYWQLNGHTVKSSMLFNDQTTYKVRLWEGDGTTTGYCADNTVMVSVTTDENGNQVRSYTDSRGLPVLKEVQYEGTINDGVQVLTSTAVNGGGVAGEKISANTDGYVEMTWRTNSNSTAVMGLDKTGSAYEAWSSFDFGVYVNGSLLYYVENSGTGTSLGVAPVAGMKIRLEKSGASIYYKYTTNGTTYTTMRTVTTTQADHHLKASMGVTSRRAEDVRISNSGSALAPVTWTNKTNAAASTINGTDYGTVAWLQTYSIYDSLGRLVYQLPPKAVAVLGTGTSLDAKSSTVVELIYKYLYDPRGRLIERKVPGAAVEYIVYDKHDRVVLTQDGNLRVTNKWMFVKYDIYNRVVYSGIYRNTAQTTRAAVQGLLDAMDYTSTPWYETETSSGVQGYSNAAFPTTGSVVNTILSVTYYDHYNFDRTGGDDYTYDASHFSGQAATRSTNIRGLTTGSKRVMFDVAGNVPGTPYWITSVIFYDADDRPIQTQANNHLHTSWTASTLDKGTVIYDFVRAVKSKSTHYQNATTSVALEDRSEYDHAGRVLKTYRKINAGGEQLLAQYEYNALGQVVDKRLHGDGSGGFLQSLDYRYTIRGWLQSINNSQLTNDGTLNDDTGDYFGQELLYNTVDAGLSNTSYYNGNISAVKWKTMDMGQATQESTNGQRSYKYSYDKSDKLLSATFAAHDNGTSWNKQVNTLNESMTYDHNGNILTLLRNQNNRTLTSTVVGGAALVMDNLVYTHTTGNQLAKVEDRSDNTSGFTNGTNATTEYTYNTIGAQTKDNNKGISSVTYNMLGKAQVVTFYSGKKIEYVYDAAGGKHTVKVWQGTTLEKTTDYAGGFVYEGGVLSFFSSPEGRVVKNGSNFEYQYAIADHQGNTRVLFTSATPAPYDITATFEGDSGDNANQFSNVDASKVVSFTAANHTTDGSMVVRMNQAYVAGPSKSLKVYPGDKVDMEVWAYHENASGFGTTTPAAMIAAVAAAFGGVSGGGGESGSIFDGVNNAVAGGFAFGGNAGDGAPAAYLNYIQFDQQYKPIDAGWERVSATTFTKEMVSIAQLAIKEPGYVFVYLSYEDESNNYVYFDDFKVTHTKSNIIQANEYYPFGMQTASSWTRENATGNNFLANGGTELNTTSQLYDLDFRNYDPALGRMNQIDPMAAKYATLSPYNYSFNNPVSFTDGNGADPQYENWNDYTGPGSTNDGYGDGSMMGMWATRYVWSGYINGTYTGNDVALNLGGAIWNGRAGMNDLDGWMGYGSDLMSGGMNEYWHPGDGRSYWGGSESAARGYRHDADAVRLGDMSLKDYGVRNGESMSDQEFLNARALYNFSVFWNKCLEAGFNANQRVMRESVTASLTFLDQTQGGSQTYSFGAIGFAPLDYEPGKWSAQMAAQYVMDVTLSVYQVPIYGSDLKVTGHKWMATVSATSYVSSTGATGTALANAKVSLMAGRNVLSTQQLRLQGDVLIRGGGQYSYIGEATFDLPGIPSLQIEISGGWVIEYDQSNRFVPINAPYIGVPIGVSGLVNVNR